MSSSSEASGLDSRGFDSSKSPLHANFLLKARICAYEGNRGRKINSEGESLGLDDFYVVWFAKTLQNWKALISTDAIQDHYWEVTHNGDKQETYVDTYLKEDNVRIKDERFNVPQSR